MKYIITILFMVLLTGCAEDYPEQIPLNTIDKANELCQTMDGVKELQVSTGCVRNGKLCGNGLLTQVEVTCNKHDAKVSILIEWEKPDVATNR